VSMLAAQGALCGAATTGGHQLAERTQPTHTWVVLVVLTATLTATRWRQVGSGEGCGLSDLM